MTFKGTLLRKFYKAALCTNQETLTLKRFRSDDEYIAQRSLVKYA